VDYNGSNSRYHLRNQLSSANTPQQVILNKPRQLANALDLNSVSLEMDVDEESCTTKNTKNEITEFY
jgi:hypothetical protein